MTQLANESQRDDLTRSSEGQPESTNLNSRETLIRRLQRGPDARTKFVDSHINKTLAFQVRSLRGEMSQEKAVEKLGMNQNAISRLENPYYGKATLTTLKRIASAYDVGLLVEFVPFSRLVDRVSGTPHIDYGLSPNTMNVPSFEEEVGQGILEESHNKYAVALELSRLYSGSTPTGTSDLLTKSAIEQSAESAAVLNFAAPAASGAICTTLPTMRTGSFQSGVVELRKSHVIKKRNSEGRRGPHSFGRRLNTRRFLSRKKISLRG
jgi:transcriptional regulator with XRE-family HTH domain